MVAKRIESRIDIEELASKLRSSLAGRGPLRCLVIDEASLIYDWDAIQKQHRQLACVAEKEFPDISIAHILVPAQAASQEGSEVSHYMEINLQKLIEQFNVLGWLTLCRWFWDCCERQESRIDLTASEEYTLQARLEDFRHQVFSLLLQEEKADLLSMLETGRMAEEKGDVRQVMGIEKAIVMEREKLRVYLLEQKKLLEQIIGGVKLIELKHVELKEFREMAEELLWCCGAIISVNGAGNSVLKERFRRLAEKLGAVVILT
jgi:hypothetical protein